jgi:hypothetical protein
LNGFCPNELYRSWLKSWAFGSLQQLLVARSCQKPKQTGPRWVVRKLCYGEGWTFFVFLFIFFSSSFIYFYSNLDIAFESKIQMYYMSLNGCTTTTV